MLIPDTDDIPTKKFKLQSEGEEASSDNVACQANLPVAITIPAKTSVSKSD